MEIALRCGAWDEVMTSMTSSVRGKRSTGRLAWVGTPFADCSVRDRPQHSGPASRMINDTGPRYAPAAAAAASQKVLDRFGRHLA